MKLYIVVEVFQLVVSGAYATFDLPDAKTKFKEYTDVDHDILLKDLRADELLTAVRLMELVRTHLVYLEAIRAYLENGGGSRGSYIVLDPNGKSPSENLGSEWRYKPFDHSLLNTACEIWFDENMEIAVEWTRVRPIPTEEGWFEKVWQEYREGQIIE